MTAVLRSGARRLLAQAIESEAAAFLALMADRQLEDGRARFVRHGHGPARTVQTGIGPVAVQRVKVRDRSPAGTGERVRFTSAILPRWCRRSRSIDALLPILYLRGISTGDFQEALAALLGKGAPNLSPSVIARLKGDWQADHEHWQQRDLSARRYVYIWADGVYLVDLKARGLAVAPELATGDGALGFWKALEEVSPTTRHQRCTVHKTVNVLDKLPKSVQPAAIGLCPIPRRDVSKADRADLREVWTAPDRTTAEAAIASFAEKYRAKYEKAVTCLVKDRDALLTFYDFPAEHSHDRGQPVARNKSPDASPVATL